MDKRQAQQFPIGTREELLRNPFLKLNQWRSCSPPDPLRKEKGCHMYERCPFSGGNVYDYDVPEIKGVAGPEYFGVEQIKTTTGGEGVIHTVLPCWQIPKVADRLEANGGLLRIIALPGEKVDIETALPVIDTVITNTGPQQRCVYVQGVQTVEVPKFPRPDKNPALSKSQFAANQARRFKERKRTERAEAVLGTFTLDDEPLEAEFKNDKRGKGGPRG